MALSCAILLDLTLCLYANQFCQYWRSSPFIPVGIPFSGLWLWYLLIDSVQRGRQSALVWILFSAFTSCKRGPPTKLLDGGRSFVVGSQTLVRKSSMLQGYSTF